MHRRLEPAWLDAQYNARAAIADAAAVLDRWRLASTAARAGSSVEIDVAYAGGPGEVLDLFPPPAPGAPVLVFIHGGYWRSLDKSDLSFVAPSFHADGAMVVVPNYALCPAVSVEHIVKQMVAALAWTWRHAARYGGDPARIVVAGHSVGGHLATMLLSCRWKQVDDELPAQLVGGAMSISGLYDLEPLRHAPFVKDDLQLTPALVKRLSPAFFSRPRGRLHAVVGGDESSEFLRQNALIRDVWGPTAVPVCESVPGKNHLTVLESLVDPEGRLHQHALRLLNLR